MWYLSTDNVWGWDLIIGRRGGFRPIVDQVAEFSAPLLELLAPDATPVYGSPLLFQSGGVLVLALISFREFWRDRVIITAVCGWRSRASLCVQDEE